MRINFELKLPSLRPSNLVRGAENGVLGAVDFVAAKTSKFTRAVRNEYRARQLANAHVAYDVASRTADMREILDRAAELVDARRKE